MRRGWRVPQSLFSISIITAKTTRYIKYLTSWRNLPLATLCLSIRNLGIFAQGAFFWFFFFFGEVVSGGGGWKLGIRVVCFVFPLVVFFAFFWVEGRVAGLGAWGFSGGGGEDITVWISALKASNGGGTWCGIIRREGGGLCTSDVEKKRKFLKIFTKKPPRRERERGVLNLSKMDPECLGIMHIFFFSTWNLRIGTASWENIYIYPNSPPPSEKPSGVPSCTKNTRRCKKKHRVPEIFKFLLDFFYVKGALFFEGGFGAGCGFFAKWLKVFWVDNVLTGEGFVWKNPHIIVQNHWKTLFETPSCKAQNFFLNFQLCLFGGCSPPAPQENENFDGSIPGV